MLKLHNLQCAVGAKDAVHEFMVVSWRVKDDKKQAAMMMCKHCAGIYNFTELLNYNTKKYLCTFEESSSLDESN